MSKSLGNRPDPDRDTPPSIRIVETLAAARGRDSTDMEPMYGAVDLEAIDDLFANSQGDLRVELTVDGDRLLVRGDGAVELF